ncbi:uncharacterized protein LOC128260124 [Drosophila gunungcola]|uniref:Uncharacterized protein n=1 Tax=Drosophila gunungcola TaxID=103775 RepID=A0A9P9YGY4_9MUSC|nr:uncharacterized protein LOC128260124 [Drosophila gunungcola]KAI8036598.1 hypothetical protein M5D96_010399 [Drosophila gunungcola]
MSESTDPHCSTSKSNLIKVHHVGVTARMQSPLKKLLPRMNSSSDSDVYQNSQNQYNMFKDVGRGEMTESTASGSSPHTLYHMHAEPVKSLLNHSKIKPQRIEFQRYSKKRPHVIVPTRSAPKVKSRSKSHKASQAQEQKPGFLRRLFESLDKMCQCQPQSPKSIIDDLPEPKWNHKEASRHTCIGIYPFEHGCADYLSTTDTHPKINAIVLADRATTYATHFWAELFGLLHIAVAFVVAFILQSYRFVLYSLVNTLIVGLLHMTSDYMLKPILTMIFNGYLQPPLILLYNILCSVRDILEPVASTLNNFMKPLATVGNSFRLVDVNYRQIHKLAKDV